MKTIEVDEELYRYIASQTQHIGESASDILRRLLMVPEEQLLQQPAVVMPVRPKGIVVSKDAGNVPTMDRVKEMRTVLISDEFAAQEKAIGRFMMILSSLYSIDAEGFAEAAAIKGRTRVYFAHDEETLLASGKTTKPKSIPSTPFWVITNTNTERKRQMIDQLMTKMGFGSDIIDKVCGEI
ncbi:MULTISPECIES: replication initiation negative regulator SeqA [unclassified Photobacterium]|uniref:replication initiation negative regulator SeqA n=1 Tax=unclassified Photobacterium TaxID=2628852 RepID=UPI000D177B69|nr:MULTISPECIES: replication initiation negative regulator SeqA [unclassified Photobacterium]PSV29147.1 replication initiation negative regulator SeqA [Photobacterium sp. GB-56]PSV33519.1 replication initiation negative regulator SeqA [Photobacterium sp. GB-72]PSV39627.1 replication initiation negative regulator SeqA [Photobacterium sp. GB-27]PSV55483.1 replication initiation negative regulator SeqA [Photobacterium sp. GB-1]PSW75598.1 replication initiation negative regulator SeqA [Photobacter